MGNVSESTPQDINAKLGIGQPPSSAAPAPIGAIGPASSPGIQPPSLDDFKEPPKKALPEEELPDNVKGNATKAKKKKDEEEEELAVTPSPVTGTY